MKVVVQRSLKASVSVHDRIVGNIDSGLVVLVGFNNDDTEEKILVLVEKLINLRIFDDENGIMNKSLIDIGGSILSISQFTLYANTEKGRRPSYKDAMAGVLAQKLYEEFNSCLRNNEIKVETGIFGEEMLVTLTNDGPVTIIMER